MWCFNNKMFRRKPKEKPEDQRRKIEISITDFKFTYSPGETVTGTVKLTNIEPIPSKEIKVNCRGYCGVSPIREDESWTAEDQYFNSTVSMDDKGILERGSHTFPFTFVIPANASSTYYGDYGQNAFKIKAFVDLPHFSTVYKTKRPTHIFILKTLNLNDVPHIQDVSSTSVTKNFTDTFGGKGTIVLKATSDLRGYRPGQVIKLKTDIENRSGKATSTVVASLMKKETYKTQSPIDVLRTVAEVVGTGVKAKKEATWRVKIVVPPLPHSTLESSALITIEYYIQVALKSPDVSVSFPIFIGGVAVDCSESASPSAPLAELKHKAQNEGKQQAEEIVTKSHSQPPPRRGPDSPHSFCRIYQNQTFGITDLFLSPFSGEDSDSE